MRLASVVISCLLLMHSISVAHAEKRVALVIGNSAYQHTPALINPKNDAQDIGKSLRDLGFSTIVATDLDRAGMDEVLDRFSRTVGGAEIALVYYSGHGMQFAGKNFLLPVDARLENVDDVNRFRLIPLEDVFDVLQGAPGARVVILDACRNNPVEDDLKRRVASMPGANRDALLTRGLSRVVTNGLIVAYATQANDVASDGAARHSPFAEALLDNLGAPDVDLRQMLFNVQDEVDRLTSGKQRPELSISLVGQYKLKPETGARDNKEVRDNKEARDNKEVAAPPVDAVAQAWQVTQNSTSQAVLEDFIRQFGNTPYGSMARARLDELKKTQVAAAAAPAHAGPPPPSAPKAQAAVSVPPEVNGGAVAAPSVAPSPPRLNETNVTQPPTAKSEAPSVGPVAALSVPPLNQPATTNVPAPYDGIWEFVLTGGPNCPVKSRTFRMVFQGGDVISGRGRKIGSVERDGTFHFSNPSLLNPKVIVDSKGKVTGGVGKGDYQAIGSRCEGSYQIRLIAQL